MFRFAPDETKLNLFDSFYCASGTIDTSLLFALYYYVIGYGFLGIHRLFLQT